MNIAYFLIPKKDVTFLYDDCILWEGIEILRNNRFMAVPVINRDNEYIGTVSEGDYLWYLLGNQEAKPNKLSINKTEGEVINNILGKKNNPPVRINATVEALLDRVVNHNFIPVIDDRNKFIGIVTRKVIITHFMSIYPKAQ